jgi:molybdenum cofactor biosynthesis protein MoaC
MTAPKPSLAVYGFEGIDETLPFLPLAARRVLDRLGCKLSLEGWLSLPLEKRQQLVLAGAQEAVPADAAGVLEGAEPPAVAMEAAAEPSATAVPLELREALGSARPLEDARWRELRPLDRYALLKSAVRPEKLARAYAEIAAQIVRMRRNPPGAPVAEAVRLSDLTHLTGTGEAHMVDVGAKTATARRAVASSVVRTTPQVIEAIAGGGVAKGDVLGVARVAGILASKRTPELIPLCHPVHTTSAAIEFEPDGLRGELRVRATVEAFDRTGVEMEAMVAASIASLTIYDMIKSADRWATIDAARLEEKSGGKCGTVTRPPRPERSTAVDPEDDAQAAAGAVARVDLRDQAPSLDEAIASVKHPGAGAVCVFLGIVRDHNEGRHVVKLEYEAYPAMAVAEMKRIAEELALEIVGVRLAVTHRTGTLAVGDVAIVCAASAPHRGEAHRACRALIDRVKARVPIWKREHGPDGAWWIGWQDARCEPEQEAAHAHHRAHGHEAAQDHDRAQRHDAAHGQDGARERERPNDERGR